MKKVFFLVVVSIGLLVSCKDNYREKENFNRYLLSPSKNISYNEVIKLEFEKVPEGVPLYELRMGNTNVIFEFSNDLSKVLTQYWEIGFKTQEDSVIGIESFLAGNDLNIYVDSYDKTKLIGHKVVGFSHRYNVVYSCTASEIANDSINLVFAYHFPYVRSEKNRSKRPGT